MKYVIGLLVAFLAFTPPPAQAAGWRFDGRAPDGTAAGWRVDGRSPAPVSTAAVADPYDGDTNAIALLMAKTGGTYTASSGGRWQFSSDDGILRLDQAGLFAQAGDGATLYMDPVNHKLVYSGQTLELQDALVAAGDITADTFHGSAAGLTGLPTFDYTNHFDRAGATGAVKSAAADAAKFLRGDGTWQEVSGGGGGVSLPENWGFDPSGANTLQLTNAAVAYVPLTLGALYYPTELRSDTHALTLGADGNAIQIDGVTVNFAAGAEGQVWTYTAAAGWHAESASGGSFDQYHITGNLEWNAGMSADALVAYDAMGNGMQIKTAQSGAYIALMDAGDVRRVETTDTGVSLRGFLSLYGNGTWVDDGGGNQGYGATEDVTISGVTLHFINGIYVGHTGP